MSSFKSIAVIGLLGALGAAVYFKINSGPEPEPPPEFSGTWGEPPTIQMPAGGGSSMDMAGNSGPAVTLPDLGSATPSAAVSGAPPMAGGGVGNAAPARATTARPPSSTPPSVSPPSGLSGPPLPAGNPAPTAAAAPVWPASANATTPAATMPPAAVSPGGPANAVSPGRPAAGGPPVAAASAAANVTYAATRKAAQDALDQGALAEALLLLSPWYGEPALSPSDQEELAGLLGQLAGTVIYSPDSYIEPPYVVRTGDTLQTIANQYRVPWQVLAKINGLNESAKLDPGQKLKVIRGPFSAVVNLANHEMVLRVGGYYAGRFHVGIGTERKNMAGHWVIKHKVINPTYYGPDRVIDADDPNNPLGEFWLGLANETQQKAVEPFGIHSTYDAKSIDRNDPRGYIRLTPRDAEDVYDILSIGSRVTIRR